MDAKVTHTPREIPRKQQAQISQLTAIIPDELVASWQKAREARYAAETKQADFRHGAISTIVAKLRLEGHLPENRGLENEVLEAIRESVGEMVAALKDCGLFCDADELIAAHQQAQREFLQNLDPAGREALSALCRQAQHELARRNPGCSANVFFEEALDYLAECKAEGRSADSQGLARYLDALARAAKGPLKA